MIIVGETDCPKCGGYLKYFDVVKRIIRGKNRSSDWIEIRRLRCKRCGSVHRELPDFILKNKQYEVEIIFGVLDGHITSDTFGYENYPCEMTMNRWLNARKLHGVL
ncbi:MAG: DUF6431 domain-containing protein [Vallitaleaceae bacterium]|nr:DUF6431 domain-containing protein [Vallitaleaceae bacterium]